jgi:hypothetical protein
MAWLAALAGMRNRDQLTADMAFGAVRRGRGVAADFGVRELAGSPVGTFLSGGAAAGLVALMTLGGVAGRGSHSWFCWRAGVGEVMREICGVVDKRGERHDSA